MKGLESLIPQKNNEGSGDSQTPKGKDSVFLIDIDLIKPNPYQPRKEFSEDNLKDLSESIKVYGVLQPLMVTKVERDVPTGRIVEYELIAGERRLRAAKLAKLPRVPAIVKHSTNKQKLEISLIENIQRDDLNAVEEARAFRRLIDEFDIKQSEIAERVSKSASYIANTLRILGLPSQMQNALAEGKISEGHTRPLLSLEGAAQKKLFSEIQSQGMTVRQAEARARELGAKTVKTKQAQKAGKAELDPKTKKLVENFKNTYNLSDVKVGTKGRKAHLAMHFSSKDDLHEWIKKLLD
ncbi:MAG: ParB/RepB/Spo0J family partition protein [Candidatus Spechtbacterales bacterium]|nr:ParB/RepB/Spo0J family partition protein [Candidatus Spechtbacterales bacterium]